MPAVLPLVPDGDQQAPGLPGLEDGHHLVGLGPLEVPLDELVPSLGGRIQNREVPGPRAVLDPVVELVGDVAEGVPAHELVIPVPVEEADDALGLLEGLGQRVEENPIEASVPEPNAVVVALVERVHSVLPCGEIRRA
jgi:hypothetical protein